MLQDVLHIFLNFEGGYIGPYLKKFEYIVYLKRNYHLVIAQAVVSTLIVFF